jgi:YD repeat-containing protein
VVDGLGKETDYVYDADGRQAAVITPDQAVSWTLFDKDGNVTETVDGLGNRTLSSFDKDGRRTATTDANGPVTQFAYDNDSRVTAVTDSNHNTTKFGYAHSWHLARGSAARCGHRRAGDHRRRALLRAGPGHRRTEKEKVPGTVLTRVYVIIVPCSLGHCLRRPALEARHRSTCEHGE